MAEVDIENAPWEPAAIESADIVVGVLSFNSAETIGPVVAAVQSGLISYFSGNRSVLVHADGGSKDGTQELAVQSALDKDSFLQVTYPVYPVHKLSSGYYPIPGRGNAVRTVFEAAGKVHAKTCAVLDANVQGLKPEWIHALVRPVFEEGFDFVSPYYLRHKYEGTILNGIVYPLIRALYGKRIHQPIGGDFAFSAALIGHYLDQPEGDTDLAGNGIDAWLTTHAISGGFRLAQVFCESRVRHEHEPPPDVSTILAQVLGPVFTEINRTAPAWQRIRGSEAVPTFGLGSFPAEEPARVDLHHMMESFRLGYQSLQDVWRLVLPPATLLELKRMASHPDESFHFEDAAWARTIYDFALAYRLRLMDRDHLLRALTPLYLGWLASYLLEVRDSTAAEAQARIETLCRAYEAQKGYLISRWRWPDRFNP